MYKRFIQFLFSLSKAKLTFLFLGIGSTIWFLIRVIPKPSRAGYPCMRAAAPVMSSFIIYIVGLGGSTILFRKALDSFKQARYVASFLSIIAFVFVLLVFNFNDSTQSLGNVNTTYADLPDGVNNPMGTGFGIFPGRVVWEWNKSATNENCPNTTLSNSFVTPINNNQDTINRMANNAIKKLSGKSSVKAGWDALFQSFNSKKLGTPSGYVAGQTIFIKINNGQAGWNSNANTLAENGTLPISETTPATVLALLTQLIDSCEIPQASIYIAEPMTHIFKHMYDPLHAKYPNVKYLDKDNKTSLGRTKITGWTTGAIMYSDNGAAMPNGITDALCNEMYDADYLINVAALKAHARNGVTLNAKLHFGSHGDHGGNDWGSFDLHDGLIATVNNDVLNSGVRGDYHMYRVLTDLMGHEKLGRNTVLFIVDGLWGGVEATDKAVKWKSAPFNNDWPNSLFFAQDGVAIESVCLDFLRAEAKVNTLFKNRPFFPAVDDHLHQAADKANWPVGISYDPEGDGTDMPSLGVHEHWNNETAKQYSRNLNSTTGKGIELVASKSVYTGVKPIVGKQNFKLYPNPFTENVRIETGNSQTLVMRIFNSSGQLILNSVINESYLWNGTSEGGNILPDGLYLIKLYDKQDGSLVWSEKIIRKKS